MTDMLSHVVQEYKLCIVKNLHNLDKDYYICIHIVVHIVLVYIRSMSKAPSISYSALHTGSNVSQIRNIHFHILYNHFQSKMPFRNGQCYTQLYHLQKKQNYPLYPNWLV